MSSRPFNVARGIPDRTRSEAGGRHYFKPTTRRFSHPHWVRCWSWMMGLGAWFIFIGCGKVGDPLPPAPRLPLRTRELAVTQRGPYFFLRLPNPNVTALQSLGFNLSRIDVYRMVEPTNTPEPANEESFAERAALVGSFGEQQIRSTATSGELVFRDGPLGQLNRRYHYAVRFVSTRGDSAALSNIIPAVPLGRVASAPRSFHARDQAQGIVVLTWEAPYSNIDGSSPPVVLGYNLYRRTSAQSQFGLPMNGAKPITSLAFYDRQFEYGGDYVYLVRAISQTSGSEVIESDDSELVSHTPLDVFPPAEPKDLTGASANGLISLFWTANTEPDLAGYNVFRADKQDAPDSEWMRLTPQPQTLTTFRDEASVQGRTYFYKVVALDQVGNESPPSQIIAQEAQ